MEEPKTVNKYSKWSSNIIILIAVYNLIEFISRDPTHIFFKDTLIYSSIQIVFLVLGILIRKGYGWTKFPLIYFAMTSISTILIFCFTWHINFLYAMILLESLAKIMALVLLSKAIKFEQTTVPVVRLSKLVALLIIIIAAIIPHLSFHQQGGEGYENFFNNISVVGILISSTLFFLFVDYLFAEDRVYVTAFILLINLFGPFLGFI